MLKRGHLPLVAALRCASEVAKSLNDLHQQGRSHGKLSPANVMMKESGAELAPVRNLGEQGGQERDVLGLGALIYEMIVGSKPPVDASAAQFRLAAPNSGLSGIRAAAMRLSGKCLGHLGVSLSMQQAATEVRLLWVVARQLEVAGAKEPPPMPVPYLVTPSAPPKPRSAPKAAPPVPRTHVAPHREDPVAMPEPEPVDEEAGESGLPPLVPIGASDFSKPAPKATPQPEPSGGHCPKCDCATVYVSRPRSWFERFLVSRRVPICRCHRCYHRYVVFMKMRISKSMPVGTERRFKPKRRR